MEEIVQVRHIEVNYILPRENPMPTVLTEQPNFRGQN